MRLLIVVTRGHGMGRVFITGSSTGLGLMAGQLLVEQGHDVVLHARNETRARDARADMGRNVPVLVGDVSTIMAMYNVAAQANRLGPFDAVIHNVAVGYRERRMETEDGLSHLFAINTLAPYVLTALIEKPKRLVYLSSGMHRSADANLQDLAWKKRPWAGAQAYAESKLHNVLLAFAMARRWPDVLSNALEPGWVATRMGGPGAPDDLDQGHRTQVWLAVSDDPMACVTGEYFYHMQKRGADPSVRDKALQDGLIEACRKLSGVPLPD
jgi:NAD(P)-dependent dehydrogenase (short-subunit alcohol dehydrogenase family)